MYNSKTLQSTPQHHYIHVHRTYITQVHVAIWAPMHVLLAHVSEQTLVWAWYFNLDSYYTHYYKVPSVFSVALFCAYAHNYQEDMDNSTSPTHSLLISKLPNCTTPLTNHKVCTHIVSSIIHTQCNTLMVGCYNYIVLLHIIRLNY